MNNFANFTDIFFWDFKRMDNVNYNFKIVDALCQSKHTEKVTILNKPITILIISIIECILYDFLRRINEHSKEIILGLDNKKINDTKNKIIDDFEPIISHIKKHNYLLQDANFYDELDTLRKIRNRIHIQNRHLQLDRNEYKIWTDDNIKFAGYHLERICNVLCNSYPRHGKTLIPFKNFPRPWENL